LVLSFLIFNISTLPEAHASVVFADTFANGSGSAWSATIGSPSFVTSPTVGGAAYSMEIHTYGDGVLENLVSHQSLLYIRCYVDFLTLPSSGNAQDFMCIDDDTGTVLVYAMVVNVGGVCEWQMQDVITRASSLLNRFLYVNFCLSCKHGDASGFFGSVQP
jgi:hypothetical protein